MILIDSGTEDCSLDGIGMVDRCGESRHDMEDSGVECVVIEGAEQLDQPNSKLSDRTTRRLVDSGLTRYQ